MKPYTREDLNNLQSSDRQYMIQAEKSYLVFGEGAAQTAFKLSDVFLALKGLVEPEESKSKKVKK